MKVFIFYFSSLIFSGGKCKSCRHPCLKCLNENSCTSCYPGYYLESNTCKNCIKGWEKHYKECPLCSLDKKFDNDDIFIKDIIKEFVELQRKAFPHKINENQCNRIINDFYKENNTKVV